MIVEALQTRLVDAVNEISRATESIRLVISNLLANGVPAPALQRILLEMLRQCAYLHEAAALALKRTRTAIIVRVFAFLFIIRAEDVLGRGIFVPWLGT